MRKTISLLVLSIALSSSVFAGNITGSVVDPPPPPPAPAPAPSSPVSDLVQYIVSLIF